MEFDIPAIHAEGYRTVTPVIITNTDDYSEIIGAAGDIKAMETLITIQK